MIEYFKNALKGNGYVFACNNVMTYSLKQADFYCISPVIHDAGYIDFLLDYCQKNSIGAIIALFDVDLPILSKNIKKFEAIGVRPIVSSERAVNICNDKWETRQFLASAGLRHPQTYISLEECKADIRSEHIAFPLIMKPRWGMGSAGVFEIDAVEELDILYKKLHKQIFDSYLNFESNNDIDHCILIQQKIDGIEFGLDILNNLHGKYVTAVAKQKLAMRAGETDIARIVDNAPFLETSKIIAEALKHVGNLDVDCFVTTNGEIYVLEMNCRFGGQYPFSHLAGVDFPAQIINWCNNGQTDEKFLQYQEGLWAAKDLVPVIV